ncbi:ArnT family glycosyltransferase [Leptolyngbya sp. PCC 6406]|uniref:ArnT family glycosyltransferase n=1 Tax=Leptolyngbya sp. PCC 6406 TaxID=1173264 RepID=UPI001CECB328|nr:glycosyltransferase family 39 protein [Leptolyngbya sp. PCC 6406]
MGLLLILRSPDQSLMPHDEGWYAQQARWIVESGDWVTQQWWGEPIHDRMMGIQWLIAVSYKLFGVSAGVARLPSAIACWGSVLLTYDLGRRCLTRQVAWWGAAILAATPIWMQAGRLAIQDVPLTALELLGIWALIRAEEQPHHRYRWGFLAGITVGLGFMLKSVMVIPVIAALTPYLVMEQRRHRHLTNPALYGGLILGFLPALSWLGLSVNLYGWMPIERTFGAVVSLAQQDFHNAGPWYYFWNIPANAFPWPFLAIPGIWIGWRSFSTDPGPSPYVRKWLWLGYPIFLFALLTAFKTRTWYYPLQLLPFVALLAALTLTTLGNLYNSRSDPRRWLIPLLSVILAGVGTLLIGAGVIALARPEWFPLPEIWRYALVALAAGIGWLVPLGVYWHDGQGPARRGHRSQIPSYRNRTLWQWGWLLGPWGAIALLYITGLWGNYNPEYLMMAEPPLKEILSAHPVNAVFTPEKISPASEASVLLTFYTPQLGISVTDWRSLNPGDYAWLLRSELAELPTDTPVLGQVRDWVLVQIPD